MAEVKMPKAPPWPEEQRDLDAYVPFGIIGAFVKAAVQCGYHLVVQ